jgi:hypothetical protein
VTAHEMSVPSWRHLLHSVAPGGLALGGSLLAVFYILVRELLPVNVTQFHPIIFGVLFI